MKKYSCKQAKHGKTAYRTPSVKKHLLILDNSKSKNGQKGRYGQSSNASFN